MTSSICWIDRKGLAETLARIGVRSGTGTRADRRPARYVPTHPVTRSARPKPEAAPQPVEPARTVEPSDVDTGPLAVEVESSPLAEVDTGPVAAVDTGPVALEVEHIQLAEPEARQIPDFEPPEGPLRKRLQAFMGWLVEITGCHSAFIVDRDGLPLIDRQADPDLLAIASSVMQLLDSINGKLLFPVGEAVSLDLEQDQLMLVSVKTPIGKYIVGRVGEQQMSRDLQKATSDALRRAFRPEGHSEAAEA